MADRDLVPLRIEVGIDPTNGHAAYPNFNLISSAARKGMDWSKYLDVHGGGMQYDKTSGHKDDSAESPYGKQTCCISVPQDFATEALELFPSTVTEMTPVEFEIFYDVKAHAHEPDEEIDTDRINGLNAQRSLMVATEKTMADTDRIAELDVVVKKALDPLDGTEAGVKKNMKKRWADVKTTIGVNLKANVPVIK
jgi:hypothetical protein